MLDSEAFEAVVFVTTVLEELGIRYVVGGSVASTAHGLIRTTMDVDLVADFESYQQTQFVSAVSEQFYVDESAVRSAIEHRNHFSLIHLNTMVKVDVFLTTNRPFDQQQLARRISVPIGLDSTETLWLLSPEDTILAKLDWFRLGGEVSERQWRDILGVIQTQGTALDLTYLRRWATQLDLSELLEQALETLGTP